MEEPCNSYRRSYFTLSQNHVLPISSLPFSRPTMVHFGDCSVTAEYQSAKHLTELLDSCKERPIALLQSPTKNPTARPPF